jgi:hypothetical protein
MAFAPFRSNTAWASSVFEGRLTPRGTVLTCTVQNQLKYIPEVFLPWVGHFALQSPLDSFEEASRIANQRALSLQEKMKALAMRDILNLQSLQFPQTSTSPQGACSGAGAGAGAGASTSTTISEGAG